MRRYYEREHTVYLEVIAPLIEGLGTCSACELLLGEADLGRAPAQRTADEYPAEWLAEHRRLLAWVRELSEAHGAALEMRVTDPRSWRGLWLGLRHRVRRYPTWVVDGRVRAVGWERAALEAALAAAPAVAGE